MQDSFEKRKSYAPLLAQTNMDKINLRKSQTNVQLCLQVLIFRSRKPDAIRKRRIGRRAAETWNEISTFPFSEWLPRWSTWSLSRVKQIEHGDFRGWLLSQINNIMPFYVIFIHGSIWLVNGLQQQVVFEGASDWMHSNAARRISFLYLFPSMRYGRLSR